MTQEAVLPWHRRMRARVRGNVLLDAFWRLGVLVVGGLLLLVGVALLVLPGPGWAMIALGLVVWASEFEWAKRWLAPLKRRLSQAREMAGSSEYRTQVRIASAIAVTIVAALLAAYVWHYGFSLDGMRLLWTL